MLKRKDKKLLIKILKVIDNIRKDWIGNTFVVEIHPKTYLKHNVERIEKELQKYGTITIKVVDSDKYKSGKCGVRLTGNYFKRKEKQK